MRSTQKTGKFLPEVLTNQILRRAADRGPSRMGACFTYQMPRALNALQSPDRNRDFSRSDDEPLQDFNPLPVTTTGRNRE